jgi:hypothetical protein
MSARNTGYGQAYTVKTEDPYAGQSTSEASSSQGTTEYTPFALTSTASLIPFGAYALVRANKVILTIRIYSLL